MAAPMRSTSSQQDAGHRARVADSRQQGPATATTAGSAQQLTLTQTSNNSASNVSSSATSFDYDDNDWDIGIGNLITDLDADIEKTSEAGQAGCTATIAALSAVTANPAITSCQANTISAMATSATPNTSTKTAAKMAIEHSATVDKGLKMKIKRTKPGSKSSEAKHEIVKSNEQNGTAEGADIPVGKGGNSGGASGGKHPSVGNSVSGGVSVVSSAASQNSNSSGGGSGSGKRSSGGHRRDKARDKHSDKQQQQPPGSGQKVSAGSAQVAEVNGLVRVSVPQQGPQRPVFPASTGPGPPTLQQTGSGGPPPSPAAATAQGSAAKPEQAKVGSGAARQPTPPSADDRSTSPPPAKKMKTENKETTDVCVGTSVGTITEPDCLGPCEPGTSVTLEGIVWHETEGVLVVNVTWRGKTYVGTLLDCTRHDWAPPRFCDSPTSDLDTRTPKGRGKRGRSSASTTPTTDLSNFTETRSSVHSKLRNGGAAVNAVKGRRGAANGATPSPAPASPTPFVPPRVEPSNKRKGRAGEEDSATPTGKKSKVTPSVAAAAASCSSPPPSPVLLECPEPNCSKKYKHINGLKYHQSHAHGSADDEDTKDVTSMSENDDCSNIEAPSPATPVKSPDKSQDSPSTPQKKEEVPSILRGLDGSQPATPRSTPPSPATPQSIQDLTNSVGSPSVPLVENQSNLVKAVVQKPGVLRYSEEFPVSNMFPGNKNPQTGNTLTAPSPLAPVRPATISSISGEPQTPHQQEVANPQQQTFGGQLQQQQQMPSQTFTQPPTLIIPSQNQQSQQSQSLQSPHPPQSPKTSTNLTPFKVKPTSALMPEDKKSVKPLPPNFKKKSRKSPASSPDPPQSNEPPAFGMEQSTGREEVQSPAYSDISDDGAPVIETDDKNKNNDKKTESGQPMQHMPSYVYPFYGQSPYLVSSVQENKNKEPEKQPEKPTEKEPKKENPEYQQKVIPQHYYPYGYMPSYPYNMDTSYGQMPSMPEEKIKEERGKDNPSPIDQNVKQNAPIPNPIQVPNPGKVKVEPVKDKHQNENHQILKESIEMKNQMSYNVYSRQQQVHAQREEDVRRFYVYQDQRRKEQHQQQQQQQQLSQQQQSEKSMSQNKVPSQSPNLKHKDKSEDKKEKDIKQEGVKPTMETQGPPPPPTSQYTYIHPSYMQSPHYGALPFDPNHPVYRGIMVPGPYGSSPYLHHPQLPRYAPEDLSRAQPPTKALDMLQHHAQYYSTHKIHELQERAIKSPTPKTSVASSSPSTNNVVQNVQQMSVQQQSGVPPSSQPTSTVPPTSGKQTSSEGKESRSPPPQRHVHTHHHTHVGLGYPMYPAPYGAAVLASQQAAAVTVINPYPPK